MPGPRAIAAFFLSETPWSVVDPRYRISPSATGARHPNRGDVTMKDSIAGIPLRGRLIAAGLLFVVATVVAYRQYTATYQWHERYSVLQWLWHPIDWNVDAGLPDIGHIN